MSCGKYWPILVQSTLYPTTSCPFVQFGQDINRVDQIVLSVNISENIPNNWCMNTGKYLGDY